MGSKNRQVSVECVRFFTEQNPWMAVASTDGTLSLYEVGGSFTVRHNLSHGGQAVVKCSWLDHGNQLVSACLDGKLRVWDPRNGSLIKVISFPGLNRSRVLKVLGVT